MYTKHTHAQRGFTLIELLVVIAIIGMLSSVILASLNGARIKARDARRLVDLKQLQLALELYYDSQASPSYPKTPLGGGKVTAKLGGLVPDYMQALPKDPSRTDNSTTGYLYCSTDQQSYALLAFLEKKNSDGEDDYCVVAQGAGDGNCGWAEDYPTCN